MHLNHVSMIDYIRNKAKMILNKMDHFGGRSSTCYTVVAAIKIVALSFMISVAVECIFYFRPCFWFLWGLLISLALFTITIIVKGAMYVIYYGLKIFMGSMKVAVYCLRSTTLFASDWALNLRIDLRSFSQLCCLCSIMIIVFHWNKHGARNVCDRVSSAVKEAKELFHSTFTVCNYHVRIIQGKLDRLSRRSSAGCVAAVFIKIWVMFVVAAIVLNCVWVTIGNLFIICTCLFCSVEMVIFGDIRQILMNLDALLQNKPISFSKIFTGLSDAGGESFPYFWQFKEEDSYLWKNFGPSDDVALEKLYCDVNYLQVTLKLTDTVLSASSSQVTVHFEEMSMRSPPSAQFLLRRCSTPSYIQEPNNKSSTQWVWYWADNDGWKKYTETMKSSGTKQEQIEAAYLNGEGFYPFRSGSHNYILTFYEMPMHQINIDPKFQTRRFVRRRPVFVSKPAYRATKSYPRGKAKDFERTRLKENRKKYRTASQRFHETIPEDQAYIVMVEEIWNEELYERYESKRKRIERKLKAKRDVQIEKLLFHGTSSDVVDAICKQNFDHRLRGKHGTKYGKGSYFAVDASYSNNYSGLGGDKTRFMFLARVLTGEYKLGMPDFRRPPLKDPNDPASDLYDSCVDDENQPKIFVIFNDEQCYPSYLIQYQLL